MCYHVTGKIKGKRFNYPTWDLELALKLLLANNLQSIWEVDENGKRKLIKKGGNNGK